ncbi:unnamed protein product [Oikopleura dioica]|uniref:RING-type domain-containing protein n=1 Tax=Oikopleura dioica TaxID=34765 RepID=E4Y8K0_OIKDI|nr:unnamed protein product [Oikopleura dioica]CBY43450.1 unnamed protein product [Oikopleura dioica]
MDRNNRRGNRQSLREELLEAQNRREALLPNQQPAADDEFEDAIDGTSSDSGYSDSSSDVSMGRIDEQDDLNGTRFVLQDDSSEEEKSSAISDNTWTSESDEIREKIKQINDTDTTIEANKKQIIKLISLISKDEIELINNNNMAARCEKKIALLNEIYLTIDANPEHCNIVVKEREKCECIMRKMKKNAANAEKRLFENKKNKSMLREINDGLFATLKGEFEKPSCGICRNDYNKSDCIQAAIRFCGHKYCRKCLNQARFRLLSDI